MLIFTNFHAIFAQKKITMAKEKTELQIKVETLMKSKHLTKVGLAEALGIPKQNVDRIFNVQKIPQMTIVAQFLGISLDELLGKETNGQVYAGYQIDGFVEYRGVVHRIKSTEDLKNLFELVMSNNDGTNRSLPQP